MSAKHPGAIKSMTVFFSCPGLLLRQMQSDCLNQIVKSAQSESNFTNPDFFLHALLIHFLEMLLLVWK